MNDKEKLKLLKKMELDPSKLVAEENSLLGLDGKAFANHII
ncbi:MAG: hypothetical protein AB9907_17735 [Flexilinea sp.]